MLQSLESVAFGVIWELRGAVKCPRCIISPEHFGVLGKWLLLFDLLHVDEWTYRKRRPEEQLGFDFTLLHIAYFVQMSLWLLPLWVKINVWTVNIISHSQAQLWGFRSDRREGELDGCDLFFLLDRLNDCPDCHCECGTHSFRLNQLIFSFLKIYSCDFIHCRFIY